MQKDEVLKILSIMKDNLSEDNDEETKEQLERIDLIETNLLILPFLKLNPST